jgi:aminopeptidase N
VTERTTTGPTPGRALRRVVERAGFAVLAQILCLSTLPVALARGISGEKHLRYDDPAFSRHEPRDRDMDVERMVLNLTFDPERKWVGGEVAFTVSPIAEPLETAVLDAAELQIKKVTLGTAALAFRTAGEKLLVDLGRKVPPGEKITFVVAYEARPRRGLFFVGPDKSYPAKPPMIYNQGEGEQNHWWFPCYDYPNDRSTFEEYYTVPAPMTALGNGRQVDVKIAPGGARRTFHYLQEVPAPSYLVSVAAAEFDIVKQDYDGIPAEYYVPRGTPAADVLRSFGRTPDMMKFFSEKIGVRYPYAKYAQSAMVDFIYGGMENISATTQTFETIHPAEVDKEASSIGLVAHELAHQWWGDLLSFRDWSHAWLSEGFATYFENLYKEQAFGEEEFQYEMLQDARRYLQEDREDYRRSIVEARYADPMDLFDSHLYPKGGWTLHMLRGIVGDDLFWKSIRRYAADHKAGTVVTEDLRRAFEAETGRSLVGFFDQWYQHGGHPEFRVTQSWDEKEHRVRLKVEQKQIVDDLTPVFTLPVRIEFAGESATWEFTVTVARPLEEFSFPLPEPPRMTRFDAGYHLLKTLEFDRSLEELSTQLSRDPDVPGRVWAAEQLGARPVDAAAAGVLAGALAKEPFWGVRADIAKSLGKIRVAAARDALLSALKDPDTRVRAEAVESLGRFRDDPKAADAIRTAFRREQNPYVRAAAAKAFAASRAPGAFDLLKEAASLPSYRDVIAAGAYAGMEDLGDPRAIPLLKEGTKYGRPRHQREAAIQALGKMARGDARKEISDFLTQLLQDPWVFARDAAIQALGKAEEEKAIPALLDASRGEIDPRLRRHARQAVASIRKGGAPADLDELRSRIDALKDTTESLRDRVDRLEGEKGK